MYQGPNKSNWSGRSNPLEGEEGFLWHNVIELLDLSKTINKATTRNIAFLGFACEEGVRRNQGRLGAKQGPDSLRSALAKQAVHFDLKKFKLYDAGNVICPGQNLESAQQLLGEKVRLLHENGYYPILLGGGHEIAYGHYLGLQSRYGSSLGIVNIDAHFDFRPYDKEPSSGTPFRQIYDDCQSARNEFNYLVLGINRAGNTKSLFKSVESVNTQYLEVVKTDFSDEKLLAKTIDQFSDTVDHIWLTVDIDAIAAAYAPGVSAPASFGLLPREVEKIIELIQNTNKLVSIDFAELNPTFDVDNRTAKLAAFLIFQICMRMVSPV